MDISVNKDEFKDAITKTVYYRSDGIRAAGSSSYPVNRTFFSELAVYSFDRNISCSDCLTLYHFCILLALEQTTKVNWITAEKTVTRFVFSEFPGDRK